MAELEIDQSNLPRVKEVCQSFAVLEDSVLAHSLQEQEIEQYYTTNIKKNQLVQNDIRMAKRMQDEEDEHRAQQSTVLRQASRQIEEQDFEYAREIQEQIQRRAEADRRREQDDEEMAKRLQEEEEQEIRRRSGEQESSSEGSTSDPALPSPHQHTFNSLRHREEQYSPTTTRWQCSTSHNGSSLTGPQTLSHRRGSAHINTTSWSNQGHSDSIRAVSGEVRETEDLDDSDTFFNNQLSLWSKRLYERSNTTRPQQQASSLQLHERNYRSLCSRRSSTDEVRRSQEETEDRHENCSENSDLQNRISRNQEQRRDHRDECEDWHRSLDQNTDRSVEVRDRRCHSESVRLHDRSRHRNRDLLRTWSCKESPDKHVRFEDDSKQDRKQQSESNKVWEMLAHILRERGVPVRFGGSGAPLQIRPQSRDSQVIHGSEVSYGDSQPHQRAFQRAATTRHSFHGDIRERRRFSYRENNGRDHREDQDRHRDNGEVYEINRRDSCIVSGERRGSKRWKEHKYTNSNENGEMNRVRRTTSECRHWHKITEERLSSEEEQEVERRVERPRRRSLQRSQSLSSSRASSRHRSRHEAAGASVEPEASLYLGELQQVLQDEELARKLQEDEEKLLKTVSPSSPRGSYPEGDFRVAQVAQDEEIARFMQKQEMKSKRRSRELEGPSSWHEHRAMISQHDRRAARERQVRRERLDSEGLPSPTDDCFPENQPPSPVTTIPKAQEIRNVAEELDPTFPTRRQSTESFRAGHADSSSGSIPIAQSGLHDFLEEPTFIPPTKRQTDKSGRSKPKEKKEGCKQQ